MKKIIALALAILMMAAIALPAMADDDVTEPVIATDLANQVDKTAQTQVTFGVTDRYTVTVPSVVAFGTDLSKTATISATDVVVAADQKLQVKIASATAYDYDGEGENEAVAKEAWTLVETSQNGSAAVAYKVALAADTEEEEATALINDDVVLTVVSNQTDGQGTVTRALSATLYFSTDGTTQSGSYADVLTFTTAVVNV